MNNQDIKVQIQNGSIASVGPGIIGTVSEGVYTLIGEMPEKGEPTFDIIHDKVHITGVKDTITSLNPKKFTDYKQYREKLKELVAAKAVLTTEEKRLAAENFVIPVEQIDQILTLDEKIAAGKPFNLNSIASREARLEAAMRYARNVIPYDALILVSQELDQHGLERLYVQKGLEGTMMVNYEGRSDSTGLFDYIYGTGGFAGAGLPSKNITFLHGLTLTEVTAKLEDILVHGNY